MTIIVICGPTGSGKTTDAGELVNSRPSSLHYGEIRSSGQLLELLQLHAAIGSRFTIVTELHALSAAEGPGRLRAIAELGGTELLCDFADFQFLEASRIGDSVATRTDLRKTLSR